jgi:hypothetical protein
VSDWDRKLSEWTAAGLVGDEQAAEIRAHESAATEAEPSHPGTATYVSPAVEAVGYVGGALAAAAAMLFMGDFVPNLTPGAQVALAALLTLVLIVGGALVRSTSPPALRLRSVLWTVAVPAAAGTGALIAAQLLELEDAAVGLVAALAALVVAAPLWLVSRAALQNVAFLASAMGTVVALLTSISDDVDVFAVGFAMWAVGTAWALLAWGGILSPSTTGLVAGAVGALIGAQTAAVDSYRGWGLALGVATVIAVLIAGVRTNRLGLLIVGGIGALVFAVQVVDEVFGSELAAAVALLLTGSLLVVGAVGAARRRGREAGP